MKINYCLLTIFRVLPNSRQKQQKQPPPNNRPNRLLLKLAPISVYSIVILFPANCRDSKIHFRKKLFNMKIAKKKVRIQTPLVNPIIDLERPLEKMLKKGGYTAITYHNTPRDNDSVSYEISLPYNGGESPEQWLMMTASYQLD